MSYDFLYIDCGRFGTPLKVRIADLGSARFVECEACAAKPPFNRRQVFVAFGQQRSKRNEAGKEDA